jgi:outer membrane lipoprotein-sorting protein
MLRQRHFVLSVLMGLGIPAALVAADAAKAPPPVPARLTASQIVERHIAARGGAQSWHAVHTMSWAGKMDAGVGDSAARSALYVRNSWATHNGKPTREAIANAEQAVAKDKAAQQVELPFVLDMERPNKARVEIQFAGKTAVQVYDGTNGWKLRPFLNRNAVEPFTQDEAKSQVGKWDLDGPLLDYAAKGTKVELESVEQVEGRNAYKLKLTAKSGDVHRIWIDAQSFLDVKVEGTPRRMDGRIHTVWVYQRDFRSVQGLKIPFSLETTVDGYPDTHKMSIERVTVNPQLDDKLFTKPAA